MEDQEIVTEFLIESSENLAQFELALVDLEKRPTDPNLLASIFRTIHTIKGTCGFFGFSTLEGLTHIAENILSQLRNGERRLTPDLTSLILETVDAVKRELVSIETTGKESGEGYENLRARLVQASNEKSIVEKAPVEKSVTAPPVGAGQSEAPLAALPVAGAPSVDTDVAAAESEKAGAASASHIAGFTIRVDVGLLDKLMNLVGELVLARNQIMQFNSGQENEILSGSAQRLNLITTQLQEGVMKTRMQPIGVIWSKLPRVVRDLATSCGKQIELEMDGADTELDKSIIEAIKDPLTHIVRNSCDHGIEAPAVRASKGKPAQGRLTLRAYHEGGQVNIEISDDGGGIDAGKVKQKAIEKGLVRAEDADRLSEREAFNLIFLPGFSTAEKTTSISGRGVGMDVVKTNVEKIGGLVDLTSRHGQGTTIRIKIPLTLAIIPGLVIDSGGERFIIPQVNLLELLRLEGEAGRKQIERIHDTPVYWRRGTLLPIAYLNEVLNLPANNAEAEAVNIVVVQAEDRQFGLVVDAIHDTQEIVVKPLGKQLKGLNAYAGATIMGDGKVVLILDVLGIGQKAGVLSEIREKARGDKAAADLSHEKRQTFLLFRAGRFERLAVPLSLVARLEEFPRERIERAGDKFVVQYRDQILELTPIASVLGDPLGTFTELADPTQVIVFSEGDQVAGLIVDQILDIHEESIRITKKSDRVGLSGSAVIAGKVTDFLDLPAVLRAAGEEWLSLSAKPASALRKAVLVADGSAFSRGLVRNYLELAGHPVIEAHNEADALEKMESVTVSAVVTSRKLPSLNGRKLVDEMRKRPALKEILVVELRDAGNDAAENLGGPFDAAVERFDRVGLLHTLQQMRDLQGMAQGSRVN